VQRGGHRRVPIAACKVYTDNWVQIKSLLEIICEWWSHNSVKICYSHFNTLEFVFPFFHHFHEGCLYFRMEYLVSIRLYMLHREFQCSVGVPWTQFSRGDFQRSRGACIFSRRAESFIKCSNLFTRFCHFRNDDVLVPWCGIELLPEETSRWQVGCFEFEHLGFFGNFDFLNVYNHLGPYSFPFKN